MNRRERLLSLASTLLAPRLLAQEARVLRIGHILKDDSAIRGAHLGSEEAARPSCWASAWSL